MVRIEGVGHYVRLTGPSGGVAHPAGSPWGRRWDPLPYRNESRREAVAGSLAQRGNRYPKWVLRAAREFGKFPSVTWKSMP